MCTLYASKKMFKLNHDNYYYNVMPFSLKNVGGTNKRLTDVVFSHQIGWNLEVYADEMIVKTTEGHSHVADLKYVLQ